MKKNSAEDPSQLIPSVPQFETRIQTVLDDGMVRGTNNSVWMLRKVPMASVTDARTVSDAVNVGTALYQAYSDLATLAGRGKHRRQVEKSYRHTHALLLNIPAHYRPPHTTKIRDYLARENQHLVPMRRELIFATLMTPTTGNGTFASAWDSVVETWHNGGSPLSDYDRDRDQLAQLFARCGFEIPDEETIHFADSWWNNGKSAGVPVLPHEQHMHYFRTMDAAKSAQRISLEDCDDWPESEYEHAISFADVENFDIRYMSSADQASRWVTSLIDAGARVISIRATLEPGKVTREELRAQKRRYKGDLEELQAQGKMDRHEVKDRFSELDSVEAAYSKGGPPTLHNASAIVGFSGVVDDADQLAPAGIVLSNMLNRQAAAWHETMLCSPVRANPHLQDLPATAVAYSGMPSLSLVGDEHGDSLAFLGLTEQDRQPAHVSATAASDGETLPIFGVYGATGSGKRLTVGTRIPTPSGWTTMGELRVGDEVFGRDGEPCTVTHKSAVETAPSLYRIEFDDGQTIDADAEHQWVVSTHTDRNSAGKRSHVEALARWQRLCEAASELSEQSNGWEGASELPLPDLFKVVNRVAGVPWSSAASMRCALDVIDAPYVLRPSPGKIATIPPFRKADRVRVWDARTALRVSAEMWLNPKGGGRRWARSSVPRGRVAADIAEKIPVGVLATVPEMESWIRNAGGPIRNRNLYALLMRTGVPSHMTNREIQMPGAVTKPRLDSRRFYPVVGSLRILADRIMASAGPRPHEGYLERVMTTAEIVAEQEAIADHRRTTAIRLPSAVDGGPVELLVPPYTMGAWLGDGTSSRGRFTGADPEICDNIRSDGFQVRDSSRVAQEHYIYGLTTGLRAANVLRNKHIPLDYLRASSTQRLALLQGLMDTDGTVDADGACELSFNNQRLAEDSLELIRSLGIKARIRVGESSYRDKTGEKKVTGSRHRIGFTTALPVFRLQRKLDRLPQKVRDTQNWLYIRSITPVPPRPAQCIQVDSSDSTYLAAGFVPTHNTAVLQWLAHQWAKCDRPQLILNPKQGNPMTEIADASGWNRSSLDEFVSSDGALDPLRMFPTRVDAVTKALSMLVTVNPIGEDIRRYTTDLSFALDYGSKHGASVSGEALMVARDAGQIRPEIVDPIFRFAEVFPMFRATFGMDPSSQPLSLSEGTTLIDVGDTSFDLPPDGFTGDPGDLRNPVTRTSMNIIRMLLWGGMAAFRHKGGVIHLDESWVVEKSAPDELDQIGRLARAWDILPVLYTQKPSVQRRLGLKGYISRALIGSIKDEDEARAALELFNLDKNAHYLERLIAPEYLPGGKALNPQSLRPLVDSDGQVFRGSVFYYADLRNRVAPVEVSLSEEFLSLARAKDLVGRKAGSSPGVDEV